MKNINVGDAVLDFKMSKLLGFEVRPTVTKINRSSNKITCEHPDYDRHYPHSFYLFEKNETWSN